MSEHTTTGYTGAFYSKNKGYKIKTSEGWKNFDGIECTGHDPIIRLEFNTGAILECNKKHKLFKYVSDNEHEVITVEQIQIGDIVLGETSNLTLISKVDTDRVEPVYEIIHVQDNHEYYTNGILSHNCEFVTYQETLINAIKLKEIKHTTIKKHIVVTDKVRWFKQPEAGMTYLVSLDPSGGTGGGDKSKSNNAAILIYEVPTMDQVAEWYDNTVSISGQVRLLNKLLRIVDNELFDQGDDEPDIYWTVENNSIGEAAVIDIQHMGLENFPGRMINEPKRTRTGRVRRGLTTTATSKKTACFTLKKLIEQDKLEIASECLLRELTDFIAKDDRSTIFSAKDGCTDDLVSALLLIVRMIRMVSKYEDDLASVVKESLDEDLRAPLPIFVTRTY